MTATVGLAAPMRSQASRSVGGGASGSSTIRSPRDSTKNDETSGPHWSPSFQSGCGCRQSQSPGATSRISTLTRG
jgi:hypothetical protein